jgi:hypothetical protein
VVDGNPLTAITDLRRTRRVVKDGVVYDVEALLRGPVVPSERATIGAQAAPAPRR